MMEMCKEANHIFVDGNQLPKGMKAELQRASNLKSKDFSDKWRILIFPEPIYNKLITFFEGNATSYTGTKISAPRSGSHFAVSLGIPFPTMSVFVDKLVNGYWAPKFFHKENKMWKYKVKSRMSILRHIYTCYKDKMSATLQAELGGQRLLTEAKSKKNTDIKNFSINVGELWKQLITLFPLIC
jgi:hypothetical protein